MAVNEESSYFAMGQGCPVHGDEYMRECTMCGAEFCRVCHPKSAVCPDCAEQEGEEEEEETGDMPDFDDVNDLDEVLDDDKFDDAEDEEEPEGGRREL